MKLMTARKLNSEEYMRKSEALATAAAALRQNVKRAEQCRTAFADLTQNCIHDLTQYCREWLQHFLTEQVELTAAIEAAIQETTHCLEQGEEPESTLGQAMWSLLPEQLQVFNCTVGTPDVQAFCQSWAHYENHLPSLCKRFPHRQHRHLFAAVFEDKVELCDLDTQESTQLTLNVNFGDGGSYISLDSHTLLCLGAYPPSSAVYAADLPGFQLTSLPPLLLPREGAGVANTPHYVYVFGGDTHDNKSCEKYSLQDRIWLPVGSMKHARYCFTPCPYLDLIYLPSPYFTLAIESFSPVTDTFTELLIALPAQMTLRCGSVAFVASGELCIVTCDQQIGRWKIAEEAEFRFAEADKACFSTQPPLVVKSLVYMASNDNGKMEKFSLQSYTFV